MGEGEEVTVPVSSLGLGETLVEELALCLWYLGEEMYCSSLVWDREGRGEGWEEAGPAEEKSKWVELKKLGVIE